ncbi:MAG: hypothetical protein GWN94_17905 [Phycisphaerae bacterium]|nr:hypothetical protein [Phycisphaerae bacterium]
MRWPRYSSTILDLAEFALAAGTITIARISRSVSKSAGITRLGTSIVIGFVGRTMVAHGTRFIKISERLQKNYMEWKTGK